MTSIFLLNLSLRVNKNPDVTSGFLITVIASEAELVEAERGNLISGEKRLLRRSLRSLLAMTREKCNNFDYFSSYYIETRKA